MSEHNLVIVYEDGVPTSILRHIYKLGAKSYKHFNIYVISPKGRPHYLEDLRSVIQGIIAYSLRISYAGSTTMDLRRIAEKLPRENTTYILASPSDGYREVLGEIGAENIVRVEV